MRQHLSDPIGHVTHLHFSDSIKIIVSDSVLIDTLSPLSSPLSTLSTLATLVTFWQYWQHWQCWQYWQHWQYWHHCQHWPFIWVQKYSYLPQPVYQCRAPIHFWGWVSSVPPAQPHSTTCIHPPSPSPKFSHDFVSQWNILIQKDMGRHLHLLILASLSAVFASVTEMTDKIVKVCLFH